MVLKTSLISLLIVVCLGMSIFAFGFQKATRLPDRRPETFLESGVRSGKIIVCAGDSITHGSVSYNYVEELQKKYPHDTFINGGVNSELAYNLFKRIDEIIECEPDYITILIGSNDVLATLSDKKMSEKIEEMALPKKPDRQWFEDQLRNIIITLQAETKAEIALLSLPPVSEDRFSEAYRKTADYSLIIKSLAAEFDLTYLPLNEILHEKLISSEFSDTESFDVNSNVMLYKSIFSHYLLGMSWNRISQRNDLHLLTDKIHLNERSAQIISDLISDFIISE